MDRLLRPDRFTTEPSEPESEKRYKHWKITLQNYLATSLTLPNEGDEPGLAAHNQKKLYALHNNVSHTIYELISDSVSYDAAIQDLDNVYIKPRSEIYNRHKLMTSRQEPLQTIDSFLQSLEKISKTCNFMAGTAEEYRKQYVRDAFINGISSAPIRQRLLENNTLTLDAAFQQARSLEQAQTQAASYENNVVASLTGVNERCHQQQLQPPLPQQLVPHNIGDNHLSAANGSTKKNDKCFFCGNARHPRKRCPARDATCNNYQKKGNFAIVCRSDRAPPSSASIAMPAAPALGAILDDLPHLL